MRNDRKTSNAKPALSDNGQNEKEVWAQTHGAAAAGGSVAAGQAAAGAPTAPSLEELEAQLSAATQSLARNEQEVSELQRSSSRLRTAAIVAGVSAIVLGTPGVGLLMVSGVTTIPTIITFSAAGGLVGAFVSALGGMLCSSAADEQGRRLNNVQGMVLDGTQRVAAVEQQIKELQTSAHAPGVPASATGAAAVEASTQDGQVVVQIGHEADHQLPQPNSENLTGADGAAVGAVVSIGNHPLPAPVNPSGSAVDDQLDQELPPVSH